MSDGSVVSLHRLRGSVDETGQRVTMDVPRRRKRKRGWRDHVSLLDVGVLNRLDLSALEYKVLFALMQFVPEKGGTEARVSIAEIAETVGVLAPSVSRIMRDLRDRRIVRTPRNGVHEVNPWITYSGDFDSWNAETENWPEPIWLRGVDSGTGEVK